ncbi:hypothetical protein [Tautonia plasticadhaerens]|uniref:Uncharacterized protein n=1 Tax=Tautonia plasticadhaerens TaxID=2527974 RepID=A0A518HCS6_9BACT|nr:hypothetical protein [Tautonia plasticadhaerens]QDV38623.1 hypothetical protein ElP_65780 [Tautonia plasticadhaerens]
MRERNQASLVPVPARGIGWTGLALAVALVGCDDGMDGLQPETPAPPPGSLAPEEPDWTKDVPPENQLSPEEFKSLDQGIPGSTLEEPAPTPGTPGEAVDPSGEATSDPGIGILPPVDPASPESVPNPDLPPAPDDPAGDAGSIVPEATEEP